MKTKKIFLSAFIFAACTGSGSVIASPPIPHNTIATWLRTVSTPTELIMKTWVFESLDYSASIVDIPAESREQFKNALEDYIASIKGKATNQFMADGNMHIYTINNEGIWVTLHVTWKLNPAGTELTTIDEQGNTMVYTVRKLDKNSLELTIDGMTLIYSAQK